MMPYEMAVYDREIIQTHVDYVFWYITISSLPSTGKTLNCTQGTIAGFKCLAQRHTGKN